MSCSGCNRPYKIVNQKYKLCQICNNKRLHPEGPTRRVPIQRTALKKTRTPSGEGDVHELLWDERPHLCTGCGEYLPEPKKPEYFSHIIRKSKEETLRLDKENYLIECLDCHTIWDNGTMDQKYQLLNFNIKMKYIFEHRKPLYYKIVEILKLDYGIEFTIFN